MKKVLFLLVSFFIFGVFSPSFVFAQSGSVAVSATVEGCGDRVMNGTEPCDGTDLGGKTCSSFGFSAGTLACSASCGIDVSHCSSGATAGSSGSVAGAVSQGSQIQLQDIPKPESPNAPAIIYQKMVELYQQILDLFRASPGKNQEAAKGSSLQGSAEPDLLSQYASSATVSLTPPEIINYPVQVRSGEELVLRGKAYANGRVEIFVSEPTTDSLVIHNVPSDAEGNFVFSYQVQDIPSSKATAAVFDIFKRAYTLDIWTLAFDSTGSHSTVSKKISVHVDKPLFSLSLELNLALLCLTIAFLALAASIYLAFGRRRLTRL